MLSEKLQEVLKYEGKLLNPNNMWPSEIPVMERYTRYANFLKACGHDTLDLLGIVERLRAAAQELREAGEFYSNQFDHNPFPDTDVAVE
jgi:hypothetical protein